MTKDDIAKETVIIALIKHGAFACKNYLEVIQWMDHQLEKRFSEDLSRAIAIFSEQHAFSPVNRQICATNRSSFFAAHDEKPACTDTKKAEIRQWKEECDALSKKDESDSVLLCQTIFGKTAHSVTKVDVSHRVDKAEFICATTPTQPVSFISRFCQWMTRSGGASTVMKCNGVMNRELTK